MPVAEILADLLDYSGDPRYPRVGRIRKLQRVPSEEHHLGYSFTFEAEVNGEWLAYGPAVYGNWAVRSDCDPGTLPSGRAVVGSRLDTTTLPIGWYALDEAWRAVNGESA